MQSIQSKQVEIDVHQGPVDNEFNLSDDRADERCRWSRPRALGLRRTRITGHSVEQIDDRI